MLTVSRQRTDAVRVAFAPRDPVLPYPAPAERYRPTPSYDALKEQERRSSVTSLVPIETTEHPPTPPIPAPAEVDATLCSTFRHSQWQDTRNRVYQAMKQLNLSQNRLRRFATCGRDAWIEERTEIGLTAHHLNTPDAKTDALGLHWKNAGYKVRCNMCRDRFCQPCAGTRSRIVANALVDLLDGQPARFLTLTVRSNDEPLTEQIDRIYKCYRRLRKTKLWIRHVYAAAATLEVTRNRSTGRWHPHLHVLAKGKYVPHADLKAEWLRITGDSSIVDIRLVNQRERAVAYLAKYVTKPMTHGYSTNPDALAEAIEALKGRRLVLLTGEWQSLKVSIERSHGVWTYVGTLNNMLTRALQGDDAALGILNSLRSQNRWWMQEPSQPP